MFMGESTTYHCQSHFHHHCFDLYSIGPLQDTITWYKIRHTGMQTVHWDIQNKEDSRLSDLSRFVLDVPVRCLHSSMVDFVPCDRILQRAHIKIKHDNCVLSLRIFCFCFYFLFLFCLVLFFFYDS